MADAGEGSLWAEGERGGSVVKAAEKALKKARAVLRKAAKVRNAIRALAPLEQKSANAGTRAGRPCHVLAGNGGRL